MQFGICTEVFVLEINQDQPKGLLVEGEKLKSVVERKFEECIKVLKVVEMEVLCASSQLVGKNQQE